MTWTRLRTSLVLAVATAVLTLAGCGSEPQQTPAAGRLQVWIEMSDNPKLFQDTFARYARANNVPVEVVCPAPHDKVLAALSSSDAPDIVVLNDYRSAQSIAYHGMTLDLRELGAQAGIDFDDIYAPVLRACQQDQKLTCLPWGMDTNALFWNKNLFEDAGLDLDRPPKTTDELAAYADKLTRTDAKGNLTQVGFIPGYPWSDQEFVLVRLGSGTYADGGHKLTVNSAANIRGYRWAQQFYTKHGTNKVIDLKSGFGTYTSSVNGFFMGKVAMIIDGEWMPGPNFIPKFAPELEYGVAPLPVPADRMEEYGSGIIDASMVVVPAGTKDRAAAGKLLAWMESPEVIADVMFQNSNLPSSKKAALDPRFKQVKYFQLFIDIASHPKSSGELSSPLHEEIQDAIDKAEEQVYEEGTDPEPLLNAVQAEFEPKLADAWKGIR